MKLIYIIIRDAAVEPVSAALSSEGYSFTSMTSTGGFLRRGNVTLLIGVESDQVDDVLAIVKRQCPFNAPGENTATVFVLNLPHFMKV